MKKTLIFFIFVVALFVSYTHSYAGWLIYHKPEFKGKIINAETKEPIDGAVIVAIYKKHPIISGPGGGSSSIINIKEALTDQNGEFNIPSYTTLIQPLSKEDNVDFIIYKAGHGGYHDSSVNGRFAIWALHEGLVFSHQLSETLIKRIEDKRRREFEVYLRTLPEQQRIRTKLGGLGFHSPQLPMKDAKKKLRLLNIPYFTLPDYVDLEKIKWIDMDEEGINLKEDSDYVVIGLPRLTTWEERRNANAISISDLPERKWPLLHKAIKEEDEWLKRHKGWRTGLE